MQYNTIVITALKIELEGMEFRKDVPVFFCGLGKVNAAIVATEIMLKYQPKHIINYGSAGSFKHKQGELIKCQHVYQRDMNVSPLGFEVGKTPFEETPLLLSFAEKTSSAPICSTGDNFITDAKNAPVGDVFEMEAYAIAKVCHKNNVDFTAYKYISDGADNNASSDWETQCHLGMEKFREIYQRLV